MKFAQTANELGWELRNIDPNSEIGPPCIDSRKCAAGQLFWALQARRDGGQFAEDALQKSAQAAVVTPYWVTKIHPSEPLVVVDDVLQALTAISRLARRNFTGKVFALTGSCGKTSAKDIISAVLAQKYRVLKSPASYNNHIGVPFTLCQLSPEWDIAVLEMGANHPGEIAALCEIAKPTAGLITMVGRAHLEGFGDLKGVAETKGELFRGLTGKRTAFVNFDDPYVVGQSIVVPNPIGYGFSFPPAEHGFARLYRGIMGESGGFTVLNERYAFPFPEFMMIHALSAVAVGHTWGVEPFKIARALKSFPGVERRMQKMRFEGVTIYDDVYNCNPSSLKAALEFIVSLPEGGKIAVLGDMMELGDFSAEEHQNAIDLCRKLGLHAWFTIGEHYGKIEGANNFSNLEELNAELSQTAKPDDVILFKGSREMKMERILNKFTGRNGKG